MTISFVIPAHNEVHSIGQAISACRAAAAERDHEIIVADDDSVDGTGDLAESLGARVVRVCERKIAAVRNRGAEQSIGDILFFVDADTQPTAAAVEAALCAMREGALGGSTVFRFDRPIPFYGVILETLSMRLCRWFKLAAGCFVFCRRESFEVVGGFDERRYAAEEWALGAALKQRGRFVVLSEPVLTSGRKLRDYTLWELSKSMVGTALKGYSQPDHLWYDRR